MPSQSHVHRHLALVLIVVLVLCGVAGAPPARAEGDGLWAWGANWSGQFGNGAVDNSATAIPLSQVSDVVAFSAGSAHTVVLKRDGTVWAWGYNRNGELANPITSICPDDTRPCSTVPVQVPGLNDVVAIDAGAYHTLALKRDGTLWAWGFNGYGELGPGGSVPAQVPGLGAIAAFAGGHTHSLALLTDGTVWSWGANYYGQLGRPSTSACQYSLPCDPAPARIEGLADIVAIFAGKGDKADHSFAIQRDGTVWAWGMNDHGELGVATADTCYVYGEPHSCSKQPIRVAGLSDVEALAVGAFHSLALKLDGSVWSWGDNSYGQLGRGPITSDPTPRPIAGLTGITQIAAGTVFNLARKSDGSVWAWGDNSYGQLGDNSLVARDTPVQVQGVSDARAIVAGGYHGMAMVHRNSPPVVHSPIVTPPAPTEGVGVVAGATFDDPDGIDGQFTCTVDYGDGSGDQRGAIDGNACTGPAHVYADDNLGGYLVTIAVVDPDGAVGAGTTTLAVRNAPPVITRVTGPGAPLALTTGGTSVSITATFIDLGSKDTHTCAFAWDDGLPDTTVPVPGVGDGSCTATHAYTAVGVYSVQVTVKDDDSGSAVSDPAFVVVYDPNAGFVTGQGSISSPAGAYVADPSLTGPADFAFVSKYKKGATTPTGETAFSFQVATFNFSSTAYQWLVVAGAKAQYKGAGAVNGVPGYSFLLTATDGQIAGGGGIDKFRIKIWETSSGALVYDNVRGASDDIDAASPQAIRNGSIVIHTR